MGHVTLTTPLSGTFVTCMLGLAVTELCTDFEVSKSTGYEDNKRDAISSKLLCGFGSVKVTDDA